MSDFIKDDYSTMLIPVHEADMREDFLQQFPELRLHKEFHADLPHGMNRNYVLKYIILTYDKGSPFVRTYKDAMVRKGHTLKEAGFKTTSTGKYNEDVEEMIANENPIICQMIVEYLKMHNNIAYSYLMVMETLYYGALADTLQQGMTKKYTELKETKAGYEQAYTEYMTQDSGVLLIKTLYKAMTSDRLDMSPESIASQIKENGIHATSKTVKEIAENLD